MNIGILGGCGKQGRALASRLVRAGHNVILGSRDRDKATRVAADPASGEAGKVSGGSNVEAAEQCDLAVLSVPYAAHRETLVDVADALDGKGLLDMTVPLRPPRVGEVHLPEGQSAALEAQQLLGESVQVAAGFHHISAQHLADPDYHGQDLLFASNHRGLTDTWIDLAQEMGFRGWDAGPLRNAVALEAFTPVLIHMNRRYRVKGGTGVAITGALPTRAMDER